MKTLPRHRPKRQFADANRCIIDCELTECIHCGHLLSPRKPWHMRKTVQTMNGPVFVAGKSKECTHPNCSHTGQHYYASGVLLIRLPYSTYGLDVLAFIGGQHEYELKQLVEIQGQLNKLGIQINERNVGKLYRQFLALLGGLQTQVRHRLAQAAEAHGGLIWAIDGLQPEAGGPLLYVLYEVLSGTVVSAIQLKQHSYEQMNEWLKPYKDLPFKVKATLSDGEDVIVKALKQTWASAPHQRCQAHVLSSLSEPALSFDSQLRQQLKSQLKQLPVVPLESKRPHPVDPLFSLLYSVPRDAQLREVEFQIRQAIRDAVNKSSRKPFYWGGMLGYEQLAAIAQVLQTIESTLCRCRVPEESVAVY